MATDDQRQALSVSSDSLLLSRPTGCGLSLGRIVCAARNRFTLVLGDELVLNLRQLLECLRIAAFCELFSVRSE